MHDYPSIPAIQSVPQETAGKIAEKAVVMSMYIWVTEGKENSR